ncbi:MAG: TonB-dependent receptor [Acidobacteria bacterium]|nr:TonB-dependent receptor [Acidobacteriota bacterium]MCI0724424.1 TonB-dependent receptor [Acidobacteriota bacterium]
MLETEGVRRILMMDLKAEMKIKATLLLLLLVRILCPAASAQTHTATVFGNVYDESGAALQAVEIQMIEDRTQSFRTVMSGKNGAFVVPALSPGRYMVTAHLAGFRKSTITGIELNVGGKTRLNIVLQVGSVQQSLSVEGTAALLQSETSAVSQVIDNRRITALPLNEREFLQLALLGAGSAPPAPESRLSTQSNSGVNVNGAREAANNFLLDGVDNNDLFLNRLVVNPSVDAIEEFRIQGSTYDAEYGRSGGAQVNVALKSGSNAVHGSLFEFLRNSRLDAKNFFDLPDRKIPQYQRNQFGGSLGGPVIASKTFYFINFEAARTRRAETRTSNVPTAQQKRGDFSGTGIPLRNPFTGQPFPGNRIPVEIIHPVGAALAGLYPDPNRNTPGQNFAAAPVARERMTQTNGKLDHQFSPNNKAFARYSFIDEFDFLPYAQKGPNLPRFGIRVVDRGQNLALGNTHVLSGRTLNDFRFGYNRLRREVFQENLGQDVFKSLGITGLSLSPKDFGYPSIVLAGYERLGDDANIPIVRRTGTFHFSDSLSHQRDRHFLKFGGEIRYYQENGYNDLFARGQLNFQPAFTGDALGDLLLGLPALSISAVNENPQALRTTASNGFFQDDWKIHSRLTLNLGVRYEFNSPPVDARDRLISFDVAARRLTPVGQNGVPRAGVDADFNNLAPRAGFSWDATGSGKLLLRSGYGIYYDSGTLIENETLYFNPPYFQLNLFFTRPPNLLTLSDPFPLGRGFSPLPSPVTLDRHYRTGYAQQWSFGVQQELRRDWLLEVNYIGSKGTHLVMKRNLNQPAPGPGDINARRPIPGFSDILLVSSDASSTYHALQARIEKRYSRALSLLGVYTFAKSVDNSSAFLESKGDDNTPQNSANIAAERGLSNFDLRHRFSGSFIYDLPFSRGPRWAVQEGWLSALVSNWQVSGILTVQSGRPFTPRLSTDNSNTGNVGGFFAHDRPNVVGDPKLDDPAPERFFNTSAFAIPQRYSFGNAGRNILIGPSLGNLDLALLKNITVHREQTLQFRAEFFNFFNHPNFKLPESFVDNPATFGRILAAEPARQIQFGMKYLF